MSVPSWVVVIDFFGGNANKYGSTISLGSNKEGVRPYNASNNVKVVIYYNFLEIF